MLLYEACIAYTLLEYIRFRLEQHSPVRRRWGRLRQTEGQRLSMSCKLLITLVQNYLISYIWYLILMQLQREPFAKHEVFLMSFLMSFECAWQWKYHWLQNAISKSMLPSPSDLDPLLIEDAKETLGLVKDNISVFYVTPCLRSATQGLRNTRGSIYHRW